mmetsp:Transcript_115829/g.362351  ORF Transcript_115829/g.362351 Transcript_115829/m.362351 type:complete len:214 (+) Transcript_115829:684-1325(+)
MEAPRRSSTGVRAAPDSPSTTRPESSAQSSHLAHVSSLRRVDVLPTMMRPRRDRVIMTLSRRQSAKKPTLPKLLLRTALKMISSFSRPWKASTEAISNARAPARPCRPPVRSTSIPCRRCGSSRRRAWRSARTWAEYGETMPMSRTDSSFAASTLTRMSSTADTSAEFTRDSPSRRSSASTWQNAMPESCCGQLNPSGGGRSAPSTPVLSFPW